MRWFNLCLDLFFEGDLLCSCNTLSTLFCDCHICYSAKRQSGPCSLILFSVSALTTPANTPYIYLHLTCSLAQDQLYIMWLFNVLYHYGSLLSPLFWHCWSGIVPCIINDSTLFADSLHSILEVRSRNMQLEWELEGPPNSNVNPPFNGWMMHLNQKIRVGSSSAILKAWGEICF